MLDRGHGPATSHGFRVSRLGFGVSRFGFGVWGSGFGVWGLGFGVQGSGFGVWGLGFQIWHLGFGAALWRCIVSGSELREAQGFGSRVSGCGGQGLVLEVLGFRGRWGFGLKV